MSFIVQCHAIGQRVFARMCYTKRRMANDENDSGLNGPFSATWPMPFFALRRHVVNFPMINMGGKGHVSFARIIGYY